MAPDTELDILYHVFTHLPLDLDTVATLVWPCRTATLHEAICCVCWCLFYVCAGAFLLIGEQTDKGKQRRRVLRRPEPEHGGIQADA